MRLRDVVKRDAGRFAAITFGLILYGGLLYAAWFAGSLICLLGAETAVSLVSARPSLIKPFAEFAANYPQLFGVAVAIAGGLWFRNWRD